MANKAGHPPGDTPSVDQLINEFLRRNDGSATWKQLKNTRKNPISDSALKAAIDRSIAAGKLIIRAEVRNGKATTLYCLPDPIPMEIAKEDYKEVAKESTKDFLRWVDHFAGHIEKAYEHDIELNVTKRYAKKPGGHVEEHVILAETQHIQRYALGLLIDFLGKAILDELGRYSQKENDIEAEQYIDAVIKTDFAVLIKNLAKLTSPKYGDTREAVVRTVKEHMACRTLLIE